MPKHIHAMLAASLLGTGLALHAAEEPRQKVNINEAGVAELDALPSVAAFEAEAIVRYRMEHGEFKSLEELKDVPGVSPRTVDNIQGELTVEPIGSRRPQ